jgi:hypothetical protein
MVSLRHAGTGKYCKPDLSMHNPGLRQLVFGYLELTVGCNLLGRNGFKVKTKKVKKYLKSKIHDVDKNSPSIRKTDGKQWLIISLKRFLL